LVANGTVFSLLRLSALITVAQRDYKPDPDFRAIRLYIRFMDTNAKGLDPFWSFSRSPSGILIQQGSNAKPLDYASSPSDFKDVPSFEDEKA